MIVVYYILIIWKWSARVFDYQLSRAPAIVENPPDAMSHAPPWSHDSLIAVATWRDQKWITQKQALQAPANKPIDLGVEHAFSFLQD